MKIQPKTVILTLAITVLMMTQALAVDYEFDAPEGPAYAADTSVERVIVVGEGMTERSNVDRSKNSAVIAPPFGSPESYQPGSGTVLLPQDSNSAGGQGNGGIIYLPPASYDGDIPEADTSISDAEFTLPDGLLYSDGSLGRLRIPSLGLSVKVYEDEDLESLAKGVGHFRSTSCWNGNVGLAGHNRGVNSYFGQIHTLDGGDRITYITKLGMKIHRRFRVSILLTLSLVVCLSTIVFADTDGTEPQITQQPDQLILQLGARWAGVEFELRTDAGVFPVPVVVDENGVLTMDLGGSSTYILSCINSSVPIPDPIENELPVDQQLPEENQQFSSDQTQQSAAAANSSGGIPTGTLILFLLGLACAVGGLIAIYMLKRRRQLVYDDWDEEDDEEY